MKVKQGYVYVTQIFKSFLFLFLSFLFLFFIGYFVLFLLCLFVHSFSFNVFLVISLSIFRLFILLFLLYKNDIGRIRTYAPDGNCLAGSRLDHSATMSYNILVVCTVWRITKQFHCQKTTKVYLNKFYLRFFVHSFI